MIVVQESPGNAWSVAVTQVAGARFFYCKSPRRAFDIYQASHYQRVQDLDSMRPSKFLPSLFASIAASCLLLGCQLPDQHAGVPPFGSLAQITSISPDTIEVLRAGEQVKLKVDVSYVLTAESGTVQLIVLAADNSDLAQDFEVLAKGRGKATLEAEFRVPATTAIQVFTPLVVQGQHPTSATDGRAFKVLPP